MLMIGEQDRVTVELQIRRGARGLRRVASRCHFGCPQVVETDAILEDGRPFPTLYWLTCPVKVKAVARLEDDGWARKHLLALAHDASFRELFLSAQRDYIERRKQEATDPTHPIFATGIGGVRRLTSIKCLHAHYAHYLVTGLNPLGEQVAEELAGLVCAARCDGR